MNPIKLSKFLHHLGMTTAGSSEEKYASFLKRPVVGTLYDHLFVVVYLYGEGACVRRISVCVRHSVRRPVLPGLLSRYTTKTRALAS